MKKKPTPLVATLVAGSMALAALATSLVYGVDPATCTLRGAAAFLTGRILAGIWCAIVPSANVGIEGGSELDPMGAVVSEEEATAA